MRRWSVLLLVDVAAVLLFAAVGRRSHAEGITAAGVARTAWPFLAGLAVGWLVARAWRRPADVVPTGVAAWLSAVVVGMLLRRATGEGTAASFVVVATVVLAVLLLGSRAALRLSRRSGA